MTLHRPTNLMGIASFHEAGERPASPIAAGAKPLTAEERAARRKRHEEMRALREHAQRVPITRDNYADLAQVIREQREAMARSMDMSRYIVGIDMAKPDSEATAMVYLGTDGRYHVMGRQKGT